VGATEPLLHGVHVVPALGKDGTRHADSPSFCGIVTCQGEEDFGIYSHTGCPILPPHRQDFERRMSVGVALDQDASILTGQADRLSRADLLERPTLAIQALALACPRVQPVVRKARRG
jgi:hypothetical protein